jgi:DNA-binding response OmpR family regulator
MRIVPVEFVTSQPLSENQRRGVGRILLADDNSVTKPYNPLELVFRVRRLMRCH